MLAPRPAAAPTEADLWASHVATLREAIRRRQPGAIDRVRTEIRKLDAELGALVSTAAVRQARARTGTAGPTNTGAISERIDLLRAKLADLRALNRSPKAAPLADATGATAETALRSAGDDGLPDHLRDAADALRGGYLLRFGQATEAVSKMEASYGRALLGERADALEVAYRAWRAEMQRLELPTWPTLETICRGKPQAEVAALRRCDRHLVQLATIAGLEVYTRVAA